MARSEVGGITVGDKGRLTLPKALRERLGIVEGSVLLAEVTEDGTLELVPAALIPPDQVWFAHRDVQDRMTEAHADIAAGRVTEITSPDGMDAYLAGLDRSGRSD